MNVLDCVKSNKNENAPHNFLLVCKIRLYEYFPQKYEKRRVIVEWLELVVPILGFLVLSRPVNHIIVGSGPVVWNPPWP